MIHSTSFRSDAQIEAIGRGLFDRTLPKAQWTHAAHFAATIWVLERRPELDASIELPSRIRAFNEACGTANTDSSGYHETITQASIRAARAFILHSPSNSLFELCNALMASMLGNSDWPFAYWSRSILLSTAARKAWVEPDLHPLPFR